MKRLVVLQMEPGDRFVTRKDFDVRIGGHLVQQKTDLRYYQIDAKGEPELINPSPEEVAPARLGHPE